MRRYRIKAWFAKRADTQANGYNLQAPGNLIRYTVPGWKNSEEEIEVEASELPEDVVREIIINHSKTTKNKKQNESNTNHSSKIGSIC